MDRISGRYPGGPSQNPDSHGSEGEHVPEIRQLEDRWARRVVRTVRLKRRRRLGIGFGLVFLVAVVIGAWLGIRSHTTPHEVVREQESASAPDSQIRREADRVLRELWRMEELERVRR